MKKNNAVKNLTRRTLAANRSRNGTVIAAIALTTLLISSVFSIGISYLKSMKMQQIRLMGTTAQVAVTYPTEDQVEKLRELPYVKAVGLQYNVGELKIASEMKDMTVSLHWYDQAEWEAFRRPACAGVVGSYPEKANGIMVPMWILRNMGIDNPQIGMEIPLTFYFGDERSVSQTETFVLSGYCQDYSYIRTGNIGSIFVSKEFAEQSGHTVEKDGAVSIAYRDGKNIDQCNGRLKQDLSLTGNQKIKTVPMYESTGTDGSTTTFAFAAVILFLMFTGYLLIYNVFYISVSKDIRFYGLLKTIGTSPRQLRKIVSKQALLLAAIGIPIGLALGAFLSFAAVPMALSLSNLETGATVSFHPIIFIGAAFFALVTTLLGAAKPAGTAAKISPAEALRYTGARAGRKRKRGTGGGNPSRMAWRNLFRDRKRAAIVLLSLFWGITAFMTVTTLISSMDTDHYVASYVQNDFVLENDTLDAVAVASGNAAKQKFDAAFLADLEKIDGITNLRTTSMEKMSMAYDPAEFSKHMDWFCKKFGVEEKLTDQQIKDNFWGYIIGLDNRYIEEFNQSGDTAIDIDAFERGDIALIGTDSPELYRDVDTMDVSVQSSGTGKRFTLGGFVPLGFQYAGGGMAPNIYVSEEALRSLASDPKIYKVNLDTEDGMEEQALEKIKSLTGGDHEITRISKLEQQEAMTDAKLMLYILGGGIALILALIGILNFINVMVTGVMTRKRELAMLESIGMTKRQMRRMLMTEGLAYGALTVLSVGTLGSAFTCWIFTLFRQQADYAVFTFPTVQMLAAIAVVLTVCAITPGLVYRSLSRDSLIDRLRETD
ncbi:ABC transporter permease [Caproiciproducens sp. NJN-50]|uniref:ABC transporter permease n=1 Tax=Acutalibacteraceae TaxID=3082771 RepID=UPI000FFE2F0A|nr:MULTISPECIES: ABC transporter permease [Acutalibacteraceae]QAT49464.1 ABC transporter permease [Caproiciproducens sp. NJN-50]